MIFEFGKGIREAQRAHLMKSYTNWGNDSIEKGGEGSRGGKIIGHTKSGKPIYEGAHQSHKSFTKQDHKDAAELNRKEHKREGNPILRSLYKREAEFHQGEADDTKNDKEEIKDIKDNIELYDDNYHVYRRRYLQTQSDEDRYKMNKWLNLRKEQEKLLKDKEGVDVKKSEDTELQKAFEILGLGDLIEKGGMGSGRKNNPFGRKQDPFFTHMDKKHKQTKSESKEQSDLAKEHEEHGDKERDGRKVVKNSDGTFTVHSGSKSSVEKSEPTDLQKAYEILGIKI